MREPVVGRVLVLVAVLNLALAAPLNVGLALLSAERGWGPAGYSVTVSAFAAGAVAGALFSVRRGGRPPTAAAGLAWVAAGGACLALCPLAPSLVPVLALTAALGFTTGPATALLLGLVQARTHEHYTGRVSALAGFASLGLAPVSYAAFGALAGAIGLTPAFEACTAATLTTAALTCTNRSVRTAAVAGGTSVGGGHGVVRREVGDVGGGRGVVRREVGDVGAEEAEEQSVGLAVAGVCGVGFRGKCAQAQVQCPCLVLGEPEVAQ